MRYRNQSGNHEQLFNQHVDNLNLSRRDDFIIESIKISYFSGWADAMNHLTAQWFNPNAEKTREILEEALEKLQAIQSQSESEDVISFDEPEPVSMNYKEIKLDE